MDFIEFLKNEERCGRQVVFDGKKFKVNGVVKFERISKLNTISEKHSKSYGQYTPDYEIKEVKDDNGSTVWYIIKSNYSTGIKNSYFTGYYFGLDNQIVRLNSKEITEKDIKIVEEKIIGDRVLSKIYLKRIGLGLLFLVLIIVIPLAATGHFSGIDIPSVGEMLSSCNIINSITVNGTYYLQRNYTNIIEEDIYFILKNGKWEDENGYNGRYEISGKDITLYIEVFGKETVLAEGTIEDGVLEFELLYGITRTYIKEQKIKK